MSQPGRNLLLGLLAWQMDFVRREQLIAAVETWTADKGTALGQVLVAQGALAEDNLALLESLVRKHVALHGDDPAKSLAALPAMGTLRKDLMKIADPDLQAGLAHLAPQDDIPEAGAIPSRGQEIELWLADDSPAPARKAETGGRLLVTLVSGAAVVVLAGLCVALFLSNAANERESYAREHAEALAAEARQQKDKALRDFESARKAERDLQQRVQKATDAAMKAEKGAVQQRLSTEQELQGARQAIDHSYAEAMANILLREPGMQAVRQKLLEGPREFYEQSARDRPGDPALQFRLGLIAEETGADAKASEFFGQAVKLLTKAPAADAKKQSDLAAAYHHLARAYQRANKLNNSADVYDQALVLWEKLAKEDPTTDAYRAGLARTQLGLGEVFQLSDRLPFAQDFHEQAVKNWAALADAHPEKPAYRRDLAAGHVALARVLSAMSKDTEAADALRAALAIQKKLAGNDPAISQYQIELARSNVDLGDLYAETGRATDAETPYQEAARLWQTLAGRYPQLPEFAIKQAGACTALALSYRRPQDMKHALAACEQALAIQRKLAEDHPKTPRYQALLAGSYRTLGGIYRTDGTPGKAEESYRSAIAIQEQLVRAWPAEPDYQAELAKSYDSLGMLHAGAKKWDQAEPAYQKALMAWEILLKEHPMRPDYALGLAGTCCNLGNLAGARGDQKSALEWYTRSLEKLDADSKLVGSTAFKRCRSEASWKRAEILTALKRAPEALADWDRALEAATAAERPEIQFPRMLALAQAGRYIEATEAATGLLAAPPRDGAVLYRIATVYSLSAAAVAADTLRTPEQRQGLAELFAAESLRLLSLAGDAGFFKTPANRDKLNTDPDLTSLRTRPEFEKLRSQLDAAGK